jgi:hypothetical protein
MISRKMLGLIVAVLGIARMVVLKFVCGWLAVSALLCL